MSADLLGMEPTFNEPLRSQKKNNNIAVKTLQNRVFSVTSL